MMLRDRPTFAPPIYNPVTGGTSMSPPTNPFRKSLSVTRAGFAGLGMTASEARGILANAGAYDQATVAEASKVYYGSTQAGSYQATANQTSILTGQSCGSAPSQPLVVLMSTPVCPPTGFDCIALAQQIQEYNLALTKQSNNKWLRERCKIQNCQNQGTPGYPRDCDSLYPEVYVPPRPNSPQSTAVLQTSGITTGFATPGSQYGTVTSGYVAPVTVPTSVSEVVPVSAQAPVTQPSQTMVPNTQPGVVQTTSQTTTQQDIAQMDGGGGGGVLSQIGSAFSGVDSATLMLLGGGALVLFLVMSGRR